MSYEAESQLMAAKPPPSAVPTTEELIRRARAMIPVLRAQAEVTERNRRVAPQAIEAFRAAGFFKLLQPARFGGLERGFSDLIRINFELGQGCGSAAWCASLGMVHQWFLALFPSLAQEEVWANPDTILAGAYAPNGTCKAVPGGYYVSGKWPYASNCENVDWLMVGVMVPPRATGEAPKHAILLLPKEQARIEDTWHVAGLAGTGSKTIVIAEETFVPEHRMLPRSDMLEGCAPGAQVNTHPLYRTPFYAALPFSLVSPLIGMAQGAVNESIAWARGPKAALPYVQMAIAEASAAVETARTVIEARVAAVERAVGEGTVSIDERVRNRRDQAYAGKLAAHAVDQLLAAQSASGMALGSAIQRHWRDVNAAARHVSLHWGDVSLLYGQHRLGLNPKGNF
ncbi:MAG TPA: acyl-CoA dehydrogenase family protein [Steroidobacter sp.]|uniref:acyl-CoA dehydrogenase family protein n=1 Tax=Steroidobacter sp. TaxID=1978227 RepID=UPI002ED9DEB6